MLVDAAVQVHRALGPGLLESAYQACLAYDLQKKVTSRRLRSSRMLWTTMASVVEVGYRLDMRVDGLILVENQDRRMSLPIHRPK